MASSARVPGNVDLVLSFLNTRVFDADVDELATADGLTDWLRASGLLGVDESASRRDVDRTRAVREALRLAMSANVDDVPIPDAAVEIVNAAARRARLTTSMTARGEARIRPEAHGVDGAIGAVLVAVIGAMQDGTWKRFKVCSEETCRGAFYDHSRARSAKWDSMEICGNRAKQRAWRERRPREPRR